MKIFKLMLWANVLVFMTTGCSIDTQQSPEALANEAKLIYDENKSMIYKDIKNLIPSNSSLILPSNSTEVGKINEVDLNNDGIEEIVSFEKEEKLVKDEETGESKTENEVGFMILDKNGDDTYTHKANWLQSGDSIEYANFYDLDNDGNKEIILLIKKENNTNMHIYSFVDDKIKDVYTLNPTWILDKSDTMDLKIKVEDINKDNKLEILMGHYDSQSSKLYFSVTNFNKDLELIDFTYFENVKDVQNAYITTGVVATQKLVDKTVEKNGIILDIPIAKDNSYMTQILYLEDGKIKKAFEDEDERLIKPYYIPVEDINGDKVIEIPMIPGSGNAYTSKSAANVSWYRWNGETNKQDTNLVFNSKIYYNYKYNFKVNLPNVLTNVYVEQEHAGDDVLFKFYYYDTIDIERKHIFTISVVNKNIIDDKKGSLTANHIVLGENEEHSFILYQNDIEELENLGLDGEVLKENFSLLY